jgi:hypothetical protein
MRKTTQSKAFVGLPKGTRVFVPEMDTKGVLAKDEDDTLYFLLHLDRFPPGVDYLFPKSGVEVVRSK